MQLFAKLKKFLRSSFRATLNFQICSTDPSKFKTWKALETVASLLNNLADYRAEFHNLVQRLESINRQHVFIERRGGLVVSALGSGSGGPGSSPVRGTALCSWARYFTLIVPLSTQVYKWVPANLLLV